MANSYGPWQNRSRVWFEYYVGTPNANSTSVSVSVTAYVQLDEYASSSGTYQQDWWGYWGTGSSTPNWSFGWGQSMVIAAGTYNVSLTDSTQSLPFFANGRTFHGLSQHGITVSVPPRYARTPTGLTVKRNSDTSQTLSWTRQSTYSSVTVQRQTNGGSWQTVGTANGNAQSFTDTTTKANSRYTYRVRGNGGSGSSGWSGTATITTTPAVPSSVTAARDGDDILVTIALNAPYATHYDIEDNGVVVGSVITRASLPFRHENPNPAVPHTYRARARVASGGTSSTTLISGWSQPSNTVQLLSKPNPPINLSPNGSTVAVGSRRVSWTHNPIDSSAQTEFEVEVNLGSGWVPAVSGTSATQSADLPLSAVNAPGTVQWRVRTKGGHPDWSDWSAVATVTLIDIPGVAIINPPTGEWDMPSLTARWTYLQQQDVPQSRWQVQLLDNDGVLLEDSGVQSGGATEHALSTRLEHLEGYTLRVRAAAGNVWSEWDELYFVVEFVSPSIPDVDSQWNEETGCMSITVTDSLNKAENIINYIPRFTEGLRTAVMSNPWPDPYLHNVHGWLLNGISSFGLATDVEGALITRNPGSTSGYIELNSSNYPSLSTTRAAVGVTITDAAGVPITEDVNVRVRMHTASGINFGEEKYLGDGRYVSNTPSFLPPGVTEVSIRIEIGASVPSTFRLNHFYLITNASVQSGFEEAGLIYGQYDDWEIVWAGTPHNSATTAYAVRVGNFSTSNGYAFLSEDVDGAPAMRISPASPSATSVFARINVSDPDLLESGGVFRAELVSRRVGQPTGAYATARTISATTDIGEFRSTQQPRSTSPILHEVSFPGDALGLQIALQGDPPMLENPVWWSKIGLYRPDYVGPWFDGDSDPFEYQGETYETTWQPDGTSIAYMGGSIDPIYVARFDIERSIDGVEWEQWIVGAEPEDMSVNFCDFEALSCGITYYRITAYAESGASVQVIHEAVSNSDATYVGGGEGFEETARLIYEVAANVSAGRSRVVEEYEGRERPVAYVSRRRIKTLAVRGALVEMRDSYEDRTEGYSATPEELEEVAYNLYPVHLVRDAYGRRVYGSLSPIDIQERSRVPQGCDPTCARGVFSFSFTLTETEAR